MSEKIVQLNEEVIKGCLFRSCRQHCVIRARYVFAEQDKACNI